MMVKKKLMVLSCLLFL